MNNKQTVDNARRKLDKITGVERIRINENGEKEAFCFGHEIFEPVSNFGVDGRSKSGLSAKCWGSRKSLYNDIRSPTKNTAMLFGPGRITKNPLDGLSKNEIEHKRDAFLKRLKVLRCEDVPMPINTETLKPNRNLEDVSSMPHEGAF